MEQMNSVIVGIDGESKCGKTTIVKAVAAEAARQTKIVPDTTNSNWIGGLLSQEDIDELEAHQGDIAFRDIFPISAGNIFRAAAMYARERQKRGRPLTKFTEDDVPEVRALLAQEGIADVLQNDPAIGGQVSHVAKMTGVQALCGTLFCDEIIRAYQADGGANLVVVDARDPVGHMRRNRIIGTEPTQIHPASIIPIYIDTPARVAAGRMGNNFTQQLAEVEERRLADATRSELPVVRPTNLVHDFSDWCRQFASPTLEVANPLRFSNHEAISLDKVQHFAGRIASLALSVALTTKTPPSS